MIAAASVLLGIYVFFPPVVLVPIIVAFDHHWIPESALAIATNAFAPLEWIANRVPLYQRMIQAEFGFCSRMGWITDLN